MDGQQAGDLLDDYFPGQFDGTVAVVHAFPLRLKAARFLTDRQTDRRRRREAAGAEETKQQHINGGRDDSKVCSHCDSGTPGAIRNSQDLGPTRI